jgi:hypothetical protein
MTNNKSTSLKDKAMHAKFDLGDFSDTEKFTAWLTQDQVPNKLVHIIAIAEDLLLSVREQKSEYAKKVDALIAKKLFSQKKLDALMSENPEDRKFAGFDDNYTQFNDLVVAMLLGTTPIEIQTVGPYACAHIDKESGLLAFDKNRLSADEKTGLLLASVIKKLARVSRSKIRIVTLLDEFNHHIDSEKNREFTQEERYMYVAFVAQLFMEMNIIKSDERPGIDYVVLLESEQTKKFPELLKLLKRNLKGEVKTTLDGKGMETISFFPNEDLLATLRLSKSRNQELRKTGVLLSTNGRATCQALDASTFLKTQNKNFLHFIMLGDHFSSQQDKVYTLLRALDITNAQKYHNTYFNADKLPSDVVVLILLHVLHKEVGRTYGVLQNSYQDEMAN